ncbi:putative neutral sphingomyelinase [Convolutriloba macropyga]|uniref:putative neutral sphingomyelinase n=1 Tax=Convolutriloba macropyga TaxID=536237 RepID=UPI003F520FF9
MPGQSLKVLTLNCWGIPHVSKNIKERFEAICQQLNENDYDVVGLQEIWSQEQYNQIIEKCSDALPYSHYFHSGMIGSGLCVFSKHPITHAMTLPYLLNGRPNMITHCDWYAGKALGYCRIHIEDWNRQYVFLITHTHAEYSFEHLKKEYLVHRTAQFCELAMAVNTFSDSKSSSGTVLLGDFNCRPNGLGCQLLNALSGLNDSWIAVHGNENDVIATTSDRPDNIFTKRHRKDYTFVNGQRIDQVWFSGKLKPKECRIRPWGHEIKQNSNIPFSDHEPVQVIFECTEEDSKKPEVTIEQIEKLGVEVTEIFRQGINDLNKYQIWAVIMLGLLCALLYVDVCFISLPFMLEYILAFVLIGMLVFYVFQLMYTIPSEVNKCSGAIANVATWPSNPQILHHLTDN